MWHIWLINLKEVERDNLEGDQSSHLKVQIQCGQRLTDACKYDSKSTLMTKPIYTVHLKINSTIKIKTQLAKQNLSISNSMNHFIHGLCTMYNAVPV